MRKNECLKLGSKGEKYAVFVLSYPDYASRKKNSEQNSPLDGCNMGRTLRWKEGLTLVVMIMMVG